MGDIHALIDKPCGVMSLMITLILVTINRRLYKSINNMSAPERILSCLGDLEMV